MPELAVTAIGHDRPGIVAAITGALLRREGNVEDSQMSILGGHFAVMLLVRVPSAVAASDVAADLERVREELGLDALTVSEVDEVAAAARPASHVLSVYGADRPGIVHAVSSTLAGLGVNITDLETRLVGSAEAPVYVMLLEVSLGGAGAERLEQALREVGGATGVDVSLRELESEAL